MGVRKNDINFRRVMADCLHTMGWYTLSDRCMDGVRRNDKHNFVSKAYYMSHVPCTCICLCPLLS